MCWSCDQAPRISQLKAEEGALLKERGHLRVVLERARNLINKRYVPMTLGYLDSQISAIDHRLRQIAWERQNFHRALQRPDIFADDPWGPLGWR
jgi:hypothetical protein